MSITSGFYNSVGYDRMYNAEQLSSIFEGLISDGVYNKVGDALVVRAAGGMSVSIGTGRAWVDLAWIKNDSAEILTLEPSDVALNRYDAVVMVSNHADDVRNGSIYIKTGIPASSPAYPTMENGEYIREIPLAYIYVGKNVSQITQANITDLRGSETCPWVTGLIDQVDTHSLFLQFEGAWREFMNQGEEEFRAWFDELTDYLDEDAEMKIAADILNLQNDLERIETSFLVGCEALVAGCAAYGVTPASNSPDDIVAAYAEIYAAGKVNGMVGDAVAGDVRKGKTFTSAAGIGLTGTLQVGLTKVATKSNTRDTATATVSATSIAGYKNMTKDDFVLVADSITAYLWSATNQSLACKPYISAYDANTGTITVSGLVNKNVDTTYDRHLYVYVDKFTVYALA